VQPKNAPAQTWFRGQPIVVAGAGSLRQSSHDFAAPADNMISIAGLQIGISLGSARHVSIPAWGR
jgi:hypothetical protein